MHILSTGKRKEHLQDANRFDHEYLVLTPDHPQGKHLRVGHVGTSR